MSGSNPTSSNLSFVISSSAISSSAISTPQWVKHAVFYQIFPDSFARRVPAHQQFLLDLPLDPWDAPPRVQGYKGGNLWGVIDRLPYLQDLGITALYLNPIFQSACNHRYHTHDYYQIDPLLGGLEAFQALLKAAQSAGIKVILDGVFNHASRGFLFFNDILEHGPHSPWVDWFVIHQWPVCAYDGSQPANYESWADHRALPKFNHDHPGVREYLMRVGEYWLHQGIDGWRLDVPACITAAGFWQEFRQRVKAINPEAYLVGEIFDDASQWLDGSQFDGVMNYPFARSTIAFVGGDRVQRHHTCPGYEPFPALSAIEYARAIHLLLQRHPWAIQLTQLNLLDSHDVARLITLVGGDVATVELAALLLLTFPGAPSIFYGDEIGLQGGHEPDCRRGFPDPDHWNLEGWNLEIFSCYRQLIALRHRHPALRTGDYQILFAQDQVYCFARIFARISSEANSLGEDQVLIIALNAGTAAVGQTVTLAGGAWSGIGPGATAENLELLARAQPQAVVYGKGTALWKSPRDDPQHSPQLHLTLPGRSGLILA